MTEGSRNSEWYLVSIGSNILGELLSKEDDTKGIQVHKLPTDPTLGDWDIYTANTSCTVYQRNSNRIGVFGWFGSRINEFDPSAFVELAGEASVVCASPLSDGEGIVVSTTTSGCSLMQTIATNNTDSQTNRSASLTIHRKLFPDNRVVKSIAAGMEHVLCLTSEGHVYSWGSNEYGQCGLGNEGIGNVEKPTLVKPDNEITTFGKIAAGWYHSAIVTKDGALATFGLGIYGALGSGTTENQYSPITIVPPPINASMAFVTDVACAAWHTLYLNSFKEVLGCGYNVYAQVAMPSSASEFGDKIFSPISLFPDTPFDVEQVRCIPFLSLINRFITAFYYFADFSWGGSKSGSRFYSKSASLGRQ
eukprot:gb/GECG01004268.1/.p1 GENE.gb/GECG01004268.1/~~gb/GECG01004268.1/.p1  ORF type:complete len:363 (+),score=31.84 gb/GECG01004268.1/:1-1089(+)